MTVYFADRHLHILGQATTSLPGGLIIIDDVKTEDVESGVAVFECTIPYDANTRSLVQSCVRCGNYVLRSSNGGNEFYTIIDTEEDTKKQTLYLYAEDAGLDLLNEICGPYEADQAYAISYYINKFASDSGFEIGVNEVANLSRKLSWDGETTATERIASVATQFDNCEISYSFAIKGMQISHKYINVYKKRGKDAGEQLRINFQVDRIVTKNSIANLATALLPTGGTPEGAENPIDLSGYTYDDGDIYLSGRYLKSREALKKWSRYLNPGEPSQNYTGHILKTYNYDTVEQSALCAHAVSKLKKISSPEVNYEVDISRLPAGTRIGDRVRIVDDAGELYVSARVLKLETSETNQTSKATLGEYLIKNSGVSEKVESIAASFAAKAQETAHALMAAQEAKSIASAATTSAATAQETAQAAASNANAAGTAAATAIQAAATAQTDATEAQSAASAAQIAANDAQADAENAAKSATDYIIPSTDGLEVGDRSNGSWSGTHTRMTGSAFSVVSSSGDTLSEFGANSVDLGKNNLGATISMCGQKLNINYDATNNYSGISADRICVSCRPDGYVELYSQTDNLSETMDGYDMVGIKLNSIRLDDSVTLQSSFRASGGGGIVSKSEIEVTWEAIEVRDTEVRMNGGKVTGLGAPASGSDAVNKTYADGIAAAAVAASGLHANGNCNAFYNAELASIQNGLNCPSGSAYGALLTMPYRQASGNSTPDFAGQIFIPNGDDSTNPNEIFYRTSLGGSWNSWVRLRGIADSGTSGIWRWIKYTDGTAECWGTEERTGLSLSANADAAYSFGATAYPSGLFNAAPVCTMNMESGYACYAYNKGVGTASTSPKWGVHRNGAAASNVTIRVAMHVIGRWK